MYTLHVEHRSVTDTHSHTLTTIAHRASIASRGKKNLTLTLTLTINLYPHTYILTLTDTVGVHSVRLQIDRERARQTEIIPYLLVTGAR